MYQNYYKLNFEYSIDIIKFWLFYPVTAHEYSGFEIFFLCPVAPWATTRLDLVVQVNLLA